MDACRLQRMTKLAEADCGCRNLVMRQPQVPVCDPLTSKKCLSKVMRDYGNADNGGLCRVPCTEEFFYTSLSSAMLSETYLDSLATRIGESADYWRKNLVGFEVFYSDMVEEVVTHTEAYTLLSLLCDIGGALGLVLGSSVLTLFQVVDFCVVVCYLGIGGQFGGEAFHRKN